MQRRLRVVKWLGTTPALGVCTFCSQEFKVPMNALKRIVDAQARLQGQFDAHRCDAEATSRGTVRGTEEEDDRKKPGDKMSVLSAELRNRKLLSGIG
jgi:hypothetical protein